MILILQIGQLLVFLVSVLAQSWHRHRWLQGFTIVVDGSQKQIMHY